MVSAQEVNKLRRKLGDVEAQAFSDADLAALLSESSNFDDALEEGLWELLTVTARWNNYTNGTRREEKAKIFDNILKLHESVSKINSRQTSVLQQVGFLTIAGSPAVQPTRDYALILSEGERL